MPAALPAPATTQPEFVLNPAARVLWRAPEVVQLELGRRSLVLDGADAAVVLAVTGRGGSLDELLGPVVLAALVGSGWLVPHEDARQAVARAGPHLSVESRALLAVHGARAPAVLAHRRATTIAVHGNGRAGAHVASVLAAAGVGRIYAVSDTPVRLAQCSPGGLTPADEGHPFRVAAARAIERAAPGTDTTALPLGVGPDFTVLATDEPVDDDLRIGLHARRCPHLVVTVAADHATTGPLVLPGRSSCLRCADLHRRDRDEGWPALAAQLSVPPPHAATNAALATLIAGLAASQVLDFLDGAVPATVDATVEADHDDWRIRRRTRPPHPDCGCLSYTS